MRHIPVLWKPTKCKSCSGALVSLEKAQLLDKIHRGTLLARILSMPIQRPIGFESAIRMLSEAEDEVFDADHLGRDRFGDKPGQYGWFGKNFVEWISSQGFHIELTGDEFEAYALQDNVS